MDSLYELADEKMPDLKESLGPEGLANYFKHTIRTAAEIIKLTTYEQGRTAINFRRNLDTIMGDLIALRNAKIPQKLPGETGETT